MLVMQVGLFSDFSGQTIGFSRHFDLMDKVYDLVDIILTLVDKVLSLVDKMETLVDKRLDFRNKD